MNEADIGMASDLGHKTHVSDSSLLLTGSKKYKIAWLQFLDLHFLAILALLFRGPRNIYLDGSE